MVPCTDIQNQLSELVDGTLSAERDRAVRAHLAHCADCAGMAEDLTRMRAAARAIGPLAPPDRVWQRIAAELPAAPKHRAARTATFWIAAAAMLVMAAALTTFVRSSMRDVTGNARAEDAVQTIEQELAQAQTHYERAIAELQAARQQQGALDPAVEATLTRSLATIDAAISETRQALAANSGSAPARASLLDALHMKVAVLQAAVVAGHGKL